MGAPAFKYKQLFKENKVNVFSSNFALYGDMSSRIMNLLSEFAPEIEIYSIDEAFLRYEKCDFINLSDEGAKIHTTIKKCTGVPVSVGFAPTKALAKIATNVAKKFTDRTKGVYIIDSEEKRIKALKWLAIGDVWGIGRQHSKRLKNMGVNTAYEFTQLSDAWIRKYMTVQGLRLKNELEGNSVLEIEEVKIKKSIATTRTFDGNYSDYDQIKERVVTFAVNNAEKLRKQKSCTNAIMIFLLTNQHRKDLAQYNKNVVVKLPFATNSTIELAKFAVQGLNKIFKKGYSYKKAGVIVMDLVPEERKQFCLFENSNPKHKELMLVLDKINNNIGQQKVKLASQDLKKTWKMRQEKLSPRYTTKLDDIINIKL
jgi:DNA polymerase V